jgi:predicted SPOUT superfamily RNA methylase MTH1
VTRTDLPAALDRDDAGVRIATSRHGVELTTRRLTDVVGHLERDGMTVAFGAPGRGLPAMLDLPTDGLADAWPFETEAGADAESGVESGAPGRFDLWLNAVPNQGSEVVRTEEAMFAALACLNLNET